MFLHSLNHVQSAVAEWIFGGCDSTKPAAKAFDSKQTQYECLPPKSGSEVHLFLTLAFSLSLCQPLWHELKCWSHTRALSGCSTKPVPELPRQTSTVCAQAFPYFSITLSKWAHTTLSYRDSLFQGVSLKKSIRLDRWSITPSRVMLHECK